MKVNRDNVLLERRMLAECLVAWWILGAAVLVSSIMGSEMTTQSRSGHEALAASWTVTYIVPNIGMGTLQMVGEM